jgi:hypothetical protein
MPSQYEVLATVLDQANITDEYGHVEMLKEILEACHALNHPKFDATMLAESIFSIIAGGWLTINWPHEEGECWKVSEVEPEADPEVIAAAAQSAAELRARAEPDHAPERKVRQVTKPGGKNA